MPGPSGPMDTHPMSELLPFGMTYSAPAAALTQCQESSLLKKLHLRVPANPQVRIELEAGRLRHEPQVPKASIAPWGVTSEESLGVEMATPQGSYSSGRVLKISAYFSKVDRRGITNCPSSDTKHHHACHHVHVKIPMPARGVITLPFTCHSCFVTEPAPVLHALYSF